MTRPPDRPQGLEPRQYAVLERVEPGGWPETVCPGCGDTLFADDYRDARTGRCIECTGRGGSLLGWVAVGALIVTATLAIAFLGWLTAPREAAVPTTEATRDLSGLRDGASGPPLAGAPRAGTSGRPGPTGEIGAALMSGTATWYCLSGSSACTRGYGQDDLVAAIDTELGFAKGDVVRVTYLGERSIDVRIVDVCLCPGDRLIDLTSGAFLRLAPLGLGVIPVTIEAGKPGMTLPPTDREATR